MGASWMDSDTPKLWRHESAVTELLREIDESIVKKGRRAARRRRWLAWDPAEVMIGLGIALGTLILLYIVTTVVLGTQVLLRAIF